MAAEIQTRLTGLDEVRTALRGLLPKLRRGLLRNSLAAGARIFRDEAQLRAPVLRATTYSGASAMRRGVRKPGTLRKAIRVRTSKRARRAGDVGVFVNVVPAKGAAKGARSPNDPFYWRFLEFGTQKMRAFGFLQASARSKGSAALQRIVSTLGPAIQKLNVKGSTR